MSQYGSIMNGPEIISGAVLEIEDFTMDHVSSRINRSHLSTEIRSNYSGATSPVQIPVPFGRWTTIFACSIGLKRPKSERGNVFEIQKSNCSTPKAKGSKGQRRK